MIPLPFIVVCTSCESIIEVRNAELIGQIVACPKCGGMVLIEMTSQSRPTSTQTPDQTRQSLPASGQTPGQTPLPSQATGFQTTDGHEVQEIREEGESENPFPFPSSSSRVDSRTDDQLGPVAAELQAEFLDGVVLDLWQKRRLILVAVGTVCLLTTFVVFLGLRFQESATLSETQNPKSEISSAKPPVPVGIGASQIGGLPAEHPDVLQDDPTSPDDNGQNIVTSLTPADEIQVEGRPDPSKDTADHQGLDIEFVIEPALSGPPRPPRTIPGQFGAAIRVTGPLVESSDDPFDDIDNRVIIQNSPDIQALEDEQGSDGGYPNDTIDATAEGTGGFDAFFGPDAMSSIGQNEPDGTEYDDGTEHDDGTESTAPESVTDIEPDIIESAESAEFVKMDINERLAATVASIHCEKAPIVDVVRALSDISGVPMQLDIDELRARGIGIEAPISLEFKGTTVAEIIDAVLEKTRLTRHEDNGVLVLGYSDEQTAALRTMRYDMTKLASLAHDPISAEQAASWLTELLIDRQPSLVSSRLGGPQNLVTDGTAAVAAGVTAVAAGADGNEIVVVGTIWQQDQARRLLFSLFYLRDLEPDNGMPPERLAPEVFGWDRVNAPLSFNLVEPIPLKKAARLIEEHTKLRVLIDHAALRAEGLSQETPVTSRVSHGTIDTVLRGMLASPDLTYRIMEANAVEITTPRAAREKMTIEIQKYVPLTDDETPESCAETMRLAFGGDASWHPETGIPGGAIVIDAVSGYMLVRQSQPLQRDIRIWFGSRHAEDEEKRTPSAIATGNPTQ